MNFIHLLSLMLNSNASISNGCEGKIAALLKAFGWSVGLQMCCNVRGLLIRAFPNAPKRRNARGAKKN